MLFCGYASSCTCPQYTRAGGAVLFWAGACIFIAPLSASRRSTLHGGQRRSMGTAVSPSPVCTAVVGAGQSGVARSLGSCCVVPLHGGQRRSMGTAVSPSPVCTAVAGAGQGTWPAVRCAFSHKPFDAHSTRHTGGQRRWRTRLMDGDNDRRKLETLRR